MAEELTEAMQSLQPKMYTLHHWRQTLPLGETTIGRLGARSLVDLGLFRGRGFYVKWSADSRLTTLAPASAQSPEEVLLGRLAGDTSPPLLNRLSVASQHDSVLFQVTNYQCSGMCVVHSLFVVSEGVGVYTLGQLSTYRLSSVIF